jgi:deoxyribodipyrimidine photo-lyase
MTDKITIFWFRQDLRLSDNPGLFEAAKNGLVLPIYILDDELPSTFKMGGASKWWLYNSLKSLNKSLDNKLNFYVGDSKTILKNLINENDVNAVYWNRCYEPWRIQADTEIKKNLEVECKSFNGSLLWEPWEILKSDKSFYKVYTPFYRNGCLRASQPREILPKPQKLSLLKVSSQMLDELKLLPDKNWYKKMENYWDVGEVSAQKKFQEFLENDLLDYKDGRNYPAKNNTSKLSPHLHFGEISPNQVWYSVQAKKEIDYSYSKNVDQFLSEICWREFSYYLLYHFPQLPQKNFQSGFDQFPWKNDKNFIKAWQKGKTGFPIIDAGMRELWQTGYMHNRVRMIVGSFLVKNLLVHWHHGEEWFWDCLVDADLANNSASWQWVAGSGVDAAPYFRIFNPITQGEKFDSEGEYTRHFIPELRQLSNEFLFRPWEADERILKSAGITLGKTYPMPIVNLKVSREESLKAYHGLKKVIKKS